MPAKKKHPVERDYSHFEGLAIVGFTPHRQLAPYENPNWLIAPLNDLYMDLPVLPYERFVWFQIHEWQPGRPVASPTDFSEGPHHPRDPNHVPWLREVSKEMTVFIRPEAQEHVPDAVVFPYDEIHDRFPRKYFNNSVSYMIAWGLCRGFKKIGVYGIDMMVSGGPGSEYGWQRPSCEYFIGAADEKLGAENVLIPKESDLCKTAHLYGSDGSNHFRQAREMEIDNINGRINELEIQRKNIDNGIHNLIGSRDYCDRILRCHIPGDDGSWAGVAPREKGQIIYQQGELDRMMALKKE